jgi:4a-hydroxytetrahydrobiopterin dehydratase
MRTSNTLEFEAVSALMDDAEIEARLEDSAWRREGDEIVRDFKFEDFAQAMAFVNRVAEAAEAANHHPDILVHGWNRVRLSVTNHSQGGLTDADFALAKSVDALE